MISPSTGDTRVVSKSIANSTQAAKYRCPQAFAFRWLESRQSMFEKTMDIETSPPAAGLQPNLPYPQAGPENFKVGGMVLIDPQPKAGGNVC